MSCLLLTPIAVARQDSAATQRPAQITPAERLEALEAEHEKLMEEWQAKAKEARAKALAAKEAGEPIPAMPMRPDVTPLIARAQGAAKDYAGTDDAVPFLVFVIERGAERDATIAAFETLADKHLNHTGLVQVAQTIVYLPRMASEEQAQGLLEKLARSKVPDVHAAALLGKHQQTIEKADRNGEAYKTARAELLEAAKGEISDDLKSDIRELIDTREKFGVGNIAPDIEGTDLDGVAFKLSDYKGKVVFLDFWGDW